MEMFCVMLLC